MDDATHERWLPVVGWDGYYEVSDLGRVRSVPRVGSDGRRLKGRILRPRIIPKTGYHRVCLSRAGKHYDLYIHRLVLEAHAEACPPGMEGRHWDGDPSNNRLSNLFWGTPSENQMDNVRLGTHRNSRKTRCKWGHEFTPENTYTPPGTTDRQCRACTDPDEGRASRTGKKCSRGDCPKPAWCKGLCRKHYDQERWKAKSLAS